MISCFGTECPCDPSWLTRTQREQDALSLKWVSTNRLDHGHTLPQRCARIQSKELPLRDFGLGSLAKPESPEPDHKARPKERTKSAQRRQGDLHPDGVQHILRLFKALLDASREHELFRGTPLQF